MFPWFSSLFLVIFHTISGDFHRRPLHFSPLRISYLRFFLRSVLRFSPSDLCISSGSRALSTVASGWRWQRGGPSSPAKIAKLRSRSRSFWPRSRSFCVGVEPSSVTTTTTMRADSDRQQWWIADDDWVGREEEVGGLGVKGIFGSFFLV